jgi:hypothetical protein
MDRTHEYDVRLFRSPANLRRQCFHEIDDRPAGRRVRGSSLRLCRPPVETMHGPAGIPETRFHFRQKCLRLGRVGNTCTRLCADKRTQRAQHKRRVFITFRGKEGQSHFSYSATLRRLTLANWLYVNSSEKNGPRGFRVDLPLRRSQLLAGERLAADSAAPLHMRDRQRAGRSLRLPYFRQLTLTRGTGH